MLKAIARFFAPPAPVVPTIQTPAGRVYHEYFVPGDVPEGASWPWSARVYFPAGVVKEASGACETREQARAAALAWAEATKKG